MVRCCAKLLVAVCVVGVALGHGISGGASTHSGSMHERGNPGRQLGPLIFPGHPKHRRRRLEGGSEQLNVSATVVGDGQEITVSWSGMFFAMPEDWIGVFRADTNLTLFATATKFKFCQPQYWKLAHENKKRGATPPKIPSSGSTTFQLINYRAPLKFLYISGNLQYPQVVALTETVTYKYPTEPQGVHLALGQGGRETLVYWTQSYGKPSRAGVKWGYESGKLSEWIDADYQEEMYKRSDMCDSELMPAGRSGWWAPGTYMHATWDNIPYSTKIYYVVGDTTWGWSKEFSFTSVPAPDPHRATSIVAFGDMGNVQADGSGQHSWDFGDQGEKPSFNTTRQIAEDPDSELVLHIGDISYAVGFLAEWDNFFHMIEPAASSKFWMTGIGNHEQGWTKSFYPGLDSGGECGVSYNSFFPFASQNPTAPFTDRQPWYDFVYANIHFVVMSTEHDFTKGSSQFNWIEDTLSNGIDRSVTPWLVFAGHRPMYVDSDFPEDQKVATQLQDNLEDLLLDADVDIALWGHFHTYQRSCRLRKGVCDESGVQHMVIGMAGYDHSDLPPTPAKWIEYSDQQYWGVFRMNFHNASFANLQYVNNADGRVLDDRDMYRDHSALMSKKISEKEK